MIIPSGPVRVMLAIKPVDFRKGADGLAALAAGTAAGFGGGGDGAGAVGRGDGSSSAMIRRIEARISSIEGSAAVFALLIAPARPFAHALRHA